MIERGPPLVTTRSPPSKRRTAVGATPRGLTGTEHRTFAAAGVHAPVIPWSELRTIAVPWKNRSWLGPPQGRTRGSFVKLHAVPLAALPSPSTRLVAWGQLAPHVAGSAVRLGSYPSSQWS